MMPVHPPEKDRTQCFNEDLEFIELAESLGFVEGWVGNHESLPWEPIAGNDIFLSAAFQRTKNHTAGPRGDYHAPQPSRKSGLLHCLARSPI